MDSKKEAAKREEKTEREHREEKTEREELAARGARSPSASRDERAALEDAAPGRTRAEAEKPVSKSRANAIDEIVDGWVADHIRGSAVSRNTEAYNHVMDKLKVLKSRLKGDSTE